MRNVNRTLQDTDRSLLPILAKFWDVNVAGLDNDERITALTDAMLDAERAERVWNTLDDAQRGALQMLIGAGGKMPMAKFGRLFGEIRQMGTAKLEREKPHENPQSIAEALFYRGLVSQGFEHTDAAPRVVIYVPDDMLRVLPIHQTGYSNLEAPETGPDEPITIEPLADLDDIQPQPASTSTVDDMTTLLAFVQLHSPFVTDGTLAEDDRAALRPYLLGPEDDRLTFLFALALSADLVEIQTGRVYTKRAETRRWLSAGRAVQVRELAERWHESHVCRDLWHIPGLHPEPGGELDDYDPAAPRDAVFGLMGALVPRQEWWSLDDFIEAIKILEPDFQRPGGDYESWYIRNDAGDYLKGFESWDAIEGALLEYYVTGPMHWLGLVDRAEDAARLTAYGRAFLGQIPWPQPPEQDDKIIVQPDGTLLVSRKASRVDRFQVARFTSWGAASDPYPYKLDGEGIQRAAEQGINTGHIANFLSRVLEDKPIPPAIAGLLENWRGGPSAVVSLEQLAVLRTTAPETMDKILDTPGIRRYLGARLGPMAVIVRGDQRDALRDALGEHGFQVDL
ncbi:MAG: hypothetical protein H6672_07165 [Anaerolineaceae bacterium]|nr:hypothetical protein [Anaerolineaceae bacterium]